MFNKGDQCKPKKFFFSLPSWVKELSTAVTTIAHPGKELYKYCKAIYCSAPSIQPFFHSLALQSIETSPLRAPVSKSLTATNTHSVQFQCSKLIQTFRPCSIVHQNLFMSLCADMSLCIKLFQSVLWHRVAKFTTITSFNIIIINQLLSAIFNLKKRLTETSFLCMLVSRALATKDVLYRSPPLCTVLFSLQHAPSSSPLSFISSSGRIFLFFQCLIFPNPPDHIKLSRIVLRLHHCVNLLYENNTPTQYVNIFEKSVV